MGSFRQSICFIFIGCATIIARGADNGVATLTTADFQSRPVIVRGFDDHGVEMTPADTATTQADARVVVAMNQFLELRWAVSPPAKTGPFVVRTTDGTIVTGEPVALENEQLRWHGAAAGDVTLPLRHVTSIVRADHLPSGGTVEQAKDDVVTLANGDVARGIVTDISGAKVTVQTDAGNNDLPLENVTSVVFAATAPPATQASADSTGPARSFRLSLADASVLGAGSLEFNGENWTVTAIGASGKNDSRTIPAALVAAVEQVNGTVSWLSSRTPRENVQIPMLETAWPARMNASITGEPIRFGDHVYTHGIGVHSYSRIVYPIEGAIKAGYRYVRTQYAIDGERPYANVTVRIRIDEKVVHERKDFRAGVLSPVVSVELPAGAKSLTLEVDYGAGYDVQDRLNWIEPALVKFAPATPATQP